MIQWCWGDLHDRTLPTDQYNHIYFRMRSNTHSFRVWLLHKISYPIHNICIFYASISQYISTRRQLAFQLCARIHFTWLNHEGLRSLLLKRFNYVDYWSWWSSVAQFFRFFHWTSGLTMNLFLIRRSISIHSVVLVASSKYFTNLLRLNYRESYEGKVEISWCRLPSINFRRKEFTNDFCSSARSSGACWADAEWVWRKVLPDIGPQWKTSYSLNESLQSD